MVQNLSLAYATEIQLKAKWGCQVFGHESVGEGGMVVLSQRVVRNRILEIRQEWHLPTQLPLISVNSQTA